MIKEATKFENSAVFEGMTSIRAIIRGTENGVNDRKILEIWLDKERKSHNLKEIGYLSAIKDKFGFEIKEKTKEEIEEITTGNSHGGIIAICGERTFPDRPTSLSSKGFYVYMDGIEDPYNFGYSLRSLYAFGVDGIILGKRNWMSAAGVVARSSAGASEMMPIYAQEDAAGIIKDLKSHGYLSVCAEEKTEATLGTVDLLLPLILVVGGEKRGISKEILDLSDIKVKIPYQREFRASLSAASATTVIAYEIARQNSKLQ